MMSSEIFRTQGMKTMANKRKKESADQTDSNTNKLAVITEPSKYFMIPTWIGENQVLQMLQRTPKEHIYKRPAKGGGTWEYVTGAYVEKVLNYVFGWNWDFEIISQQLVGSKKNEQVITLGKLTVKDGSGHTITKTQNGRKDVAYKTEMKGGQKVKTEEYLDLGNDYKASATDALKKCASLLGIASDIYGKQEFKEIKQEEKQSARITRTSEDDNSESGAGQTVSKPATTSNEKALSELFIYALSKGATKGNEKAFIEEKLGHAVDWDNIQSKDVFPLRTELMSKIINRNNGNATQTQQ